MDFTRPKRCRRQRTGREDRHSNFYEIPDNLAQAGGYLSGYFVRGGGKKATITETVLDADLPRLVVFVGRDLTRASGCTMRSLRNARRLWACREGLIEKPELTYREWLAAGAMLARRPTGRAP